MTRRVVLILLALFVIGAVSAIHVKAAAFPQIVMPNIKIEGKALQVPRYTSFSITILMMLTVMSLAPYILMMMTSFVRVTIVLSFIRSALGTQQVPPTQILMGLGIFITFFVMSPVMKQINDHSVRPFIRGEVGTTDAITRATEPLRDFMLRQVQKDDLALFFDMAKLKRPRTKADVPLHVLTPAFMVSEIKTGFEIGFLIYIPFLVIDMVVASVLMSMGMFMLSPMQISLPFKLLLFVMINGWELIIKGLVLSFR